MSAFNHDYEINHHLFNKVITITKTASLFLTSLFLTKASTSGPSWPRTRGRRGRAAPGSSRSSSSTVTRGSGRRARSSSGFWCCTAPGRRSTAGRGRCTRSPSWRWRATFSGPTSRARGSSWTCWGRTSRRGLAMTWAIWCEAAVASSKLFFIEW